MISPEKAFGIHKKTGINVNQKVAKPKVTVWQLTHIQSKMRIIHGIYSLCKNELNKQPFAFRKQYKIEPYKQ